MDEALPPRSKPVVLFDGGCPLCSREIGHYQRLAGSDQIDWVDLTTHKDVVGAFGVSKATAMARFHVRQANGQWATGAYGFAEVWSHLNGYRWLSAIVRRLGLLPALDWCYTKITNWRLRRRCNDGSCNTSGSAN